MLKRTMSLLTLFVLLGTLLSACGSTPSATTQPTTAQSEPAQSAVETTAAETEATAAASEATTAPAETTAAGAAAPAGDSAGLITASFEQQATWIKNFNPFVGDNRIPTTNGIYEPLIIYNEVNGEVVPWLATAYEWSDDNKKLTFTIREGVEWSDGQPFTANDVVFTFNLLKETAGLQGSGAGAVAGEEAYVESVTAPDDTTVELVFSRVFTPGLFDIGQQNIVPEHIWKDVEDPVKFTNETPVGTGPFTEVQNFQNQIWELHRNPNYWQEGKPMFEGFRFPSYPGNDQANLATVNGENDWAGNFIPDIEKTYVAKDPENNGYWFPALGATVMLYANTTKKPFDDPNVRKAISMAIDRDQIVKVAMYDYTHPADATGLSDAFNQWRSEEAVTAGDWVKQDVARANELLDAAGLTQGAGGIRTTADGTPMQYDINVVSGWTDWVSSVQIISQNLKAIGINATVKTYDFSAWIERVQNGDFDLSIGWSSGGATPFNYYRDQMSQASVRPVGETAGANWHRYANEEADALMEQFVATSDENEQKEIANQLQMVFVESAPAIPLFPGPMWYEYNTKRFTDFPNEENPYAVGSPFRGPSQLLVMTTVKSK